ncbi:fibronectin type III domain-containing protein [Chryseobacterium sp. GP-SGM7]|uniref:fibronectin type III domain-containing protein n=1 Tax=Chryseobacterium sp. GP-SGM7 TaxID=3411323 RepID=UPI003B94DF39
MKKVLLMYLFLIGTFISAQITLGSGTTSGGVSTSVATVPWSTYYGYSYTQQILTKANINANAAGNITGLKFYLASAQSLSNSNQVVVYLGHTNKTAFSSSTDWIPVTSLTQVYSGVITNASGVVEITLSTPFPYDNVNNLVIAVDENKAGDDGGEHFYAYTNSANNTLYYRSDTVNPDPAALTQSGSRSSTQSVVTLVGLTPSAIPGCPTVTAPAAAATAVSVTPTITWNSVGIATGYRLSMGTTPGGTDVLNNVNVGNVTTYTVPTALQFNTQYYYTLTSYNGSVSSTGCTERTFTTGSITCPVVSAPVASASGVSLTPTITWAATPGATGYRISMGTSSGGTNIMNNVDVGNVVTYTLPTSLNHSTMYYYTVNSYNGGLSSTSCSVRNFSTVCSAITPAYTNNFSIFPGVCWALANGGSPATGVGTGTTNYWYETGFLYSGFTGAATINLYDVNRAGWLISPAFNLSAGGYRVKFDYGVTGYNVTTASAMGSDDVVQFAVSSDGGTTWTVLQTWNAANAPSNTSNSYIYNLTSTTGSNVKFALFGSDGTVNDAEDYNFYVDNFVVETIPTCDAPQSVAVGSVTSNSASLSWVAPTPAPGSGYEYVYSTTNATPTTGTATSALSVPLSPLAPATTYYYWVRAACSSSSKSVWVTGSFTTLATPPANDNCSGAIVLTPGSNFAQNAITTTNAGATSDGTPQSCQTNANNNIWYSVVVPPSGNLTIETKAATGSPYTDSVINVFSGTCGSLVNVACDDDSGDDAFSLVSVTGQTPGSTLLVSVWRWSNSSVVDGAFRLSAYDASLSTSEATGTVKNNIKAYPNPFADVLNISDVSNVKSIYVMDVSGKLIKTFDKPESALQLRELNSGMYLVVLNMKDGSKQTIKAIKK